MTTESDFTVASAPEITGGGVYDIVSKIAPFAFDGMDVAISATFDEFREKITFALECTEQTQPGADPATFLAVVRANEELLAARLADARDAARASRAETLVSLEGIGMDPTWPTFLLTAGPYEPENETDNPDKDDDV